MEALKADPDAFWVADDEGPARPERPKKQEFGDEAELQKWRGEIEAHLEAHDLPPFKSFGNWREGKAQILKMEAGKLANPFQHVLAFLVREANGQLANFLIRFQPGASTKKTMIIVPIINGMVIMIRQYRVAMQDWYIELPRQYAANGNQSSLFDRDIDLACNRLELGDGHRSALKLLGKKLAPVLLHRRQGFEVRSVTCLSPGTAQDTSCDTARPEVWEIEIVAPNFDPNKLRGNDSYRPRAFELASLLLSGADGHPTFSERGIDDFQTLGALMLWQQHDRQRQAKR